MRAGGTGPSSQRMESRTFLGLSFDFSGSVLLPVSLMGGS
jgi:hypothetical protein